MNQGCQVPFRISRRNVGFILRRCSGKGPHLVMMGKPRGFSLVVAGFSSFDREHREPLVVPQGSPVSTGVVRGTWGLLSSHCRADRPQLGNCFSLFSHCQTSFFCSSVWLAEHGCFQVSCLDLTPRARLTSLLLLSLAPGAICDWPSLDQMPNRHPQAPLDHSAVFRG